MSEDKVRPASELGVRARVRVCVSVTETEDGHAQVAQAKTLSLYGTSVFVCGIIY